MKPLVEAIKEPRFREGAAGKMGEAQAEGEAGAVAWGE